MNTWTAKFFIRFSIAVHLLAATLVSTHTFAESVGQTISTSKQIVNATTIDCYTREVSLDNHANMPACDTLCALSTQAMVQVFLNVVLIEPSSIDAEHEPKHIVSRYLSVDPDPPRYIPPCEHELLI